MKFRVEIINDRPMAVFDDQPPPRNWLLQFFFEDARTFGVETYLAELDAAVESEDDEAPTGMTGNHVDVSFYPDRVIIEELYPSEETTRPVTTVLAIELARQLLIDWGNDLAAMAHG